MERIGIAASKIAKGNLFFYNFIVLSLTILFSTLIYFLAGSAIVLVLVLIAIISSGGTRPSLESWIPVMFVSLVCLSFVVGLFSFLALIKNIKLKRHSI